MDKTKLVVGQMGSPGGDGKLWVALPDNAEPYVTVVAPGIKHYNAGPVDNTGMQKYPLVITASTNGTAVDLSTTKPEFCVGQQVTFTLAGLPMGSISNMVGKWQLPTNYVNNVYQQFVLFSPAPTVYDVNPGLLANTNQVSCWYVKGNGGHIMVGLSLLFNNGQYANVAANGDFAIYRPTFSGFQNDGNGLDWDSPYLVGTMDWDVNLDSKYDGLFGVTQTLNSNNENSDYYTGGFDTLDGDTEIYGTPNTNGPSIYIASDPIIKHNIFFGDAPKAIAAPCANMIVNFNDYLRFKPGVLPNDGNIYVTIATNGWYVNGSACLIGSISPNDLPPATAPVNNVAFPTWTAVRHGGGH